MLKKSVTILLFIAVVALFTAANHSGNRFRANLTGGQENPPVATDARGQFYMNINTAGDLSYRYRTENAEDAFAAHIHCAPVGQNGPVGVSRAVGSPVVTGTISAPNAGNSCGWADLGDILDAIESGNAYVNVHSPVSPSGEIRGQLVSQ